MPINPERGEKIDLIELDVEKAISKTNIFIEQLFSNNLPSHLSSRILLVRSSIICDNEKFTKRYESLQNTSIHIDYISAFYDPNTDKIYIKENFKNDEHTLIHEMLHFISVKSDLNNDEKHKSGFRIDYKNGLTDNDRLNEAVTVFLSAFISSNIGVEELSKFDKYYDIVRFDIFNQIRNRKYLSKTYKKYVEKLTDIFDYKWRHFFETNSVRQQIKFFQSYFDSDIYEYSTQADKFKNIYNKKSFFEEFILNFDDIDKTDVTDYKNLLNEIRNRKYKLISSKYLEKSCIKYIDNYLNMLNGKNDNNISYTFVWPDMLNTGVLVVKEKKDKYKFYINSGILLDNQNLSEESSFSFKNNIIFAIRAGLIIENIKKGNIVSFDNTLNDIDVKKSIEKMRFFM